MTDPTIVGSGALFCCCNSENGSASVDNTNMYGFSSER